jgi:Ca-activated chloride channel family protein
MIDLANPWLLTLLPLPLLVWWCMPPVPESRGGALRVPFFADVAGPASATPVTRRLIVTLMSVAWLLLVLAAARPRFVGEPLPVPTVGRDLMLALDISGSMAREDFSVSGQPVDRLTIVKAVANEFVLSREGDRLGLLLFGSRAYLQTPLTFDRQAVTDMLREAELGLAGEETALGDALGLAVKHLRDRPAEERVLVLLSDGANNAGVTEPLVAAQLAAESGVRVYTIGVGADRMVVDSMFGSRVVNPAEDLDERTLEQIAQLTGGAYFRAKDTQGLLDVYAQIDTLEPTEGDATVVRPTTEIFHWPLSGAFALAVAIALSWLARRSAFIPRLTERLTR